MKVEIPAKDINFPALEKDVLAEWSRSRVFERSVSKNPVEGSYSFYDGPPFATGLPHFGHFVPSSIKDAFPRYFTMKGHRVERRFGWDCHGVPVELLVQKELGLNGKLDIEKFGIARFNEACRQSVLRYAREWRQYMARLGRWVDMENEYRTMDLPFMESVWHVVKQLWEKGFLYEGRFVVSYSAALGTTLSNFEASLDYREVQDPSLTLKVSLRGAHAGKHLLVWTTTPWTLPANVGVAIDAKALYAEIFDHSLNESFYILEKLVPSYWSTENSHTKVRTFPGAELCGACYDPLFASDLVPASKTAFCVYGTDFVLHDTGTGAVHLAPAFGEDDFNASKLYDLPCVDHLDAAGRFTAGNLPEIVGLGFKEGDKPIIQNLKKRGLVFRHETFSHSYPHCYRSGTPLMYRAMPSWFVKVEAHRDLLLRVNSQIHWVPDHVQDGRFGKWLEGARDWNIGRSRYWGNPIPIWKNDDTGETLCIGSVAELQQYSQQPVTDLHMEFIDHIKIPSKRHPGTWLSRVPFVLDCWFESGSMPYAQNHYPFENKEHFERSFPADFICEGLDQTRGWFYTLTLLSAFLFAKPAFKNVVVNGLVLAEDGRKMSKSLKNYPDPMATLNEFGADAVRLFLLSSPATVGEEVRFSVEGVKESTRRLLLPLWHAYSFFATYASVDGWDPEDHRPESVSHELDRWILLRLNQLTKAIDDAMKLYQIARVSPALVDFLDTLNNWYIRRNRRRFWEGDKAAYATLYRVLLSLTQLLAPFAPFAAEVFFRKLALTPELQNAGSVHLTDLPDFVPLTAEEESLLQDVDLAIRVVELGRAVRVAHRLKNRQPLQSILLATHRSAYLGPLQKMESFIRDELNVKRFDLVALETPGQFERLEKDYGLFVEVKPNFKTLGKKFGNKIGLLQNRLKNLTVAERLLAYRGQSIDLMIDGQNYSLLAEDYTKIIRKKEGHQGDCPVHADGDLMVFLDSALTPELRQEGLIRELVSLVQKARKSADFRVEDRIALFFGFSSPALEAALVQHKQFLQEETLGQMVFEPLPDADFSAVVDCEGIQVTLALKRLVHLSSENHLGQS